MNTIATADIDIVTITGRKALKELSPYRHNISTIEPPEGFVTGEEFRRQVKERLRKRFVEHGLL